MTLDRPAPTGRPARPAPAAAADAGTWDLYIGAPVYTADGERLGTLVSHSAGEIVVERGHFLQERYVFARHDLARYEHGVLHLRLRMATARRRRLAP